MSKIAMIGDTHWGIKSDAQTFYDYFEKSYEWMFNEIDSREITDLIQLGDLFDRRKFINFKTLHEAKRIFLNRFNEYNSHVLAGNHDVYFRNTNEVNSVGLLLKEYDIKVYESSPQTVVIGGEAFDIYPWICSDNFHEVMQFMEASNSKYAVGHFEFAMFEMYKGQMADHGMDSGLFSKYERVFSGHYHTRSEKGNVIYTGTPYELTWGDYNDPKGFYILDTETGETEFVRNPHTKFQKLVYDDKEKSMTSDLDSIDVTGKYVKLIVANKTDYYAYDLYVEKLLTKGAEDVKIIEESINAAIEAVDSENLTFDDTPTLIDSFVDSMDDMNLDPGKLKSILRGLYIEASNI